MEILIYQRQRVDHEEQDGTTYLVPQFTYYVTGPPEICPSRISMEQSRTVSPCVVLKGLCRSKSSISSVVVRSMDVYEKLSGYPTGLVLGWVAWDDCPVWNYFTYQAVESRFWESFSWLSIILHKRRKIEVPRARCSMLGGVKNTTQGVKVKPVCGLSPLV